MAKRSFNRRSKAEQVSEGIDLTGKNALVTGANTGLGKETARVLALRGARVTLACRDLSKGEQAIADIVANSNVAAEQLDLLCLDLNKLSHVRQSAAQFCGRQRPLHLLVNNAGIMIPMRRLTDDGFEAHLGINHLGHFLFTHLLMEPLRQAKAARLVVLSSAALGMASLTPELADLNWERRKYRGFASYGDSKLMNLMFAREFNRRFGDQGIVANALHPGIIATELARDQSAIGKMMGVVALPFMKSVSQGAATSVYVATSPEYSSRGGLYFSNCGEAKPMHKYALDDQLAEKVWQRSEELVGV